MRCIRVVNFGRLAQPSRLGNLKNGLLVFFPHADRKPSLSGTVVAFVTEARQACTILRTMS
jgi:hypothetical protein